MALPRVRATEHGVAPIVIDVPLLFTLLLVFFVFPAVGFLLLFGITFLVAFRGIARRHANRERSES